MTGWATLRAAAAKVRGQAGRVRRAASPESFGDDDHPERLAVLPFVTGRCLEVGCGHRKTHPAVLGVDLVPKGSRGRVGNARGRLSEADVVADGEKLPFADRSFDSLVARHNLEHYVDTAGTLIEWGRVLRSGGPLALIVPDEGRYAGRTLDLDPTHYHGYSEAALSRLVRLVGGFESVTTAPVIDGWSFMLTATRGANDGTAGP
jgi:SAM-dependent methyltransferase